MTNDEFSDIPVPQPTGHDDASSSAGAPTSRRPLGFWLKALDRRISDEMGALFADEGLSRRDWRLLSLIDGDADDERLAHKLRHRPGLLDHLVERGWVEAGGADGSPALTDSGRETRERLSVGVNALRARIAGTVSPEDFATTLAALEAIARELGWDETTPLPRGRRGGRRGFGRGHGHGHGSDHGHRGFPDFRPGRPGFGPKPHRGPHAADRDVHVHVHVHEHRLGR